jgi:hypothetical protein
LHSFIVLYETNILNIINQYLDNYYQIKTKLLQYDATYYVKFGPCLDPELDRRIRQKLLQCSCRNTVATLVF